MSDIEKLVEDFDAYFRSANGVRPNARISVPTEEWSALREALKTLLSSAQSWESAVPQAVQADKCAQDVFNDGVSIGLFDIPKHTANAICSGINAVTGTRVDWHDIGGRVHLKALPATHPTQQVMDAIAALQKVRDIAVSALLTGSLDRQDWIDDMDRIAAQAKQGGASHG